MYMMTPEEFLEFQYGIDIKEDIDKKKLIHPFFATALSFLVLFFSSPFLANSAR